MPRTSKTQEKRLLELHDLGHRLAKFFPIRPRGFDPGILFDVVDDHGERISGLDLPEWFVSRVLELLESKEQNNQAESHKERHKFLHTVLDELVADFITHTGSRLSTSTVLELMNWSVLQTETPTHAPFSKDP